MTPVPSAAHDGAVLTTPQADDDGFARWEAYFVAQYGPDWRDTRRGAHGACAYCSGRVTTKMSQLWVETGMSRPSGRKPSCDK